MKRAGRFALLFCLAAALAFAEGKEGGEGNLFIWKWANFLVLAGALGYLLAKTLPPLFTAAAAAMRVAESQAVDTAGGT